MSSAPDNWERERDVQTEGQRAYPRPPRAAALWKADRDDSLVYSDFTPLDDPEPLQRDLFK